MDQILLKSGTINPEKLGALQSELKKSFYNVRLKFFRADLPKQEFGRPKNIFPSDPGSANFAAVRVSNRDCLEFYKTAMKSTAVFFSENFSDVDVQKINDALRRTDIQKPAELPKPVFIPRPVQKSFFDELIDWIKGFFGK